jgi:predicted regulator of Ras-like GTPase activity (Roadblock/LC7/MglB family)
LDISGNYTIKKDGVYIRAAFEIDTDAERFARVLLAKTTVGERDWPRDR